MQAAFIVSFPSDFPSADDVARSVTGIFGEQPHATAAAFREGVWALTLKSGAGERVVVEFHPQHRNAVIEVDSTPSHFQWVILEALRRLGGEPNVVPPKLASKRRDEVKWWEALQLRHRILGR